MKRSIFKIALTCMLFVLGACATDDGVLGGGGSDEDTIILNSVLEATFDGTANDQSLLVTQALGTAGVSTGIDLKVENGVFNKTTVTITLDNTDTTEEKARTALIKGIKEAITPLLNDTENAIKGLSKDIVDVIIVYENQNGTATVTIKTEDGYLFEDKSKTKNIIINFTGEDIPTIINTIYNETLNTVFDGSSNDKSLLIEKASGTAGIVANKITLTSINGVFSENLNVDVELDSSDNDATKQSKAIGNAIKIVVEDILKVEDNHIKGLSQEIEVNVTISTQTIAKGTITISPIDGFKFENNETTKTIELGITGTNFATSGIVDESAFTISAVSATHGKAGVSEFTVPSGFGNVGSSDGHQIAVNFHGADNEDTEKKYAVKKAMEGIVLPKPQNSQVKISTVGEVTNDGNPSMNSKAKIKVTFAPLPGFKFANGDTTKTVEISLIGAFLTTKQTIDESGFVTQHRDQTYNPGYGQGIINGGVSSITFTKSSDGQLIQKAGTVSSILYHGQISDTNNRKTYARNALKNMFHLENRTFRGRFPEGMKLNKADANSVVIKKKEGNPNEDDWGELYATFIVTFIPIDESYIFTGSDQTQRKVEIKVGIRPQ